MNINYKNILNFISCEQIASNKDKTLEAYNTGAGNDFLGWTKYPYEYDQEEFARIKKAADFIKENAEVLVVIGIGGSYLGAKAVIEALKPYFANKGVEIVFCGHTLSSTYTKELIWFIEIVKKNPLMHDRNIIFILMILNKLSLEFEFCPSNVISKSGTTTEPAVAFRLCKELLEKKYKEEASKRIFATTDKARGALRTLATLEGYETFVVPDDIGGRYSWFTAVGLLPIACAGIDIDELMRGSRKAYDDFTTLSYEENPALIYASIRNLLYRQNKKIEVLVTYEPKLSFISEWWKQLFGESEGKDGVGLFPASLVYSTDLHSMGQYIQEGERIMFETILDVLEPNSDIVLKADEANLDGLNYLEGKNLSSVNKMAELGTILAHVDGGVPNVVLEVEKIDEYNIGYLLYFFMFSCGVCCYMQGINPFNQPGVESYKKNMFALLGKPGFEELKKELEKRL